MKCANYQIIITDVCPGANTHTVYMRSGFFATIDCEDARRAASDFKLQTKTARLTWGKFLQKSCLALDQQGEIAHQFTRDGPGDAAANDLRINLHHRHDLARDAGDKALHQGWDA